MNSLTITLLLLLIISLITNIILKFKLDLLKEDYQNFSFRVAHQNSELLKEYWEKVEELDRLRSYN